MAQVSVQFDTINKSLSVTVDGKPVENVKYVSFCGPYDEEGDEFGCSIEMSSKDVEHDMRTYTRLCASESTEARTPAGKEGVASQAFPGFLEVASQSQTQLDIAAFMAHRN